MNTEFILPDIGEGIVECELLEWLVAEGDVIEEDQPVAEVMTDKATVQIPAMHAGTVRTLHYQPGDIAKVHAPLFAMTVANNDVARDVKAHGDVAPEDKRTDSAQTVEKPNTSDSTSNQGEDFLLPDIGEGIVECEIVTWQVNEGDKVAEDQVIVEVMTDKAVVEIPAKHAGKISRLYYKEGEIAKVHAPLFSLLADNVYASASSDKHPQELQSPDQPLQDQQSWAPSQEHILNRTEAADPKASSREGQFEPPVIIPGKVLASPAVRRVAREKQIDLATVKGTGKKGRVLKQDVVALSEVSSSTSSSVSQSHKSGQSTSHAATERQTSVGGNCRTEKVRGVQAAMAKQMQLSVQTIPHFSVSDELQMDNLIALRNELKPVFEGQGVKLSFMPFFIKALSLALTEFPILNSQLNDDATELTYFDDHNIGFAVDSKIGLLVPNIKRVQDLSLFDLAKQMQQLIDQAREGKLPGESLKGGTISISNIGVLGGITATPVINKPEAAIVALGKTQKLPRFDKEGTVTAQHIMQVNWSGDHRIIDGATMVRFNNLWCSYLKAPSTMLMHLR